MSLPQPRAMPFFWASPLGHSAVLTFVCLLPAIYDTQIVGNFENKSESGNSPSDGPAGGDIELVREAKKNVPEPQDYSYSERDVILYNLSIGATEQELHWTFENHEDFAALPSFGVIPQFLASSGIPLDFLPNFNPVRNFRPTNLVPSGSSVCVYASTDLLSS